MQLTAKRNVMRVIILPILLPTVAACSSLTNHSTPFPENLNVIQLSDGGICLDAESAARLAQFKADYESF